MILWFLRLPESSKLTGIQKINSFVDIVRQGLVNGKRLYGLWLHTEKFRNGHLQVLDYLTEGEAKYSSKDIIFKKNFKAPGGVSHSKKWQ